MFMQLLPKTAQEQLNTDCPVSTIHYLFENDNNIVPTYKL